MLKSVFSKTGHGVVSKGRSENTASGLERKSATLAAEHGTGSDAPSTTSALHATFEHVAPVRFPVLLEIMFVAETCKEVRVAKLRSASTRGGLSRISTQVTGSNILLHETAVPGIAQPGTSVGMKQSTLAVEDLDQLND